MKTKAAVLWGLHQKCEVEAVEHSQKRRTRSSPT